MNDRSTEQTLYRLGLAAILVVAAAAFFIKVFEIPLGGPLLACPLYSLTGLFCPGCGGTRAVYALLHLQLWRSFCYYPPVPYCAAVYLWFMISHTIEKLSRYRLRIGMKWNSAWLWIALVILALNVLVKDGALLLFRIDLLQMIP